MGSGKGLYVSVMGTDYGRVRPACRGNRRPLLSSRKRILGFGVVLQLAERRRTRRPGVARQVCLTALPKLAVP